MKGEISRRGLLRRFVAATIGGMTIAAMRVPAAPGRVCADLEAMDSGAKSLRSSLNYTESAPEADKSCSACAFFQSGSEGCGTCQILNGPVNPRGRCDSWSQKS